MEEWLDFERKKEKGTERKGIVVGFWKKERNNELEKERKKYGWM